MLQTIFLILSLLIGFSTRQQAIHYKILPKSRLYLEGSTNVNRFECLYKKDFLEGTLHFENSQDGNWFHFENAIWELKTESFDCENKMMNKDLYKSLQSKTYPHIKIQLLKIFQKTGQKLGKTLVHLESDVQLTMAGISKNLRMPIKAQKISENQYHFVACQDILMSDFKVTPPSPFFGTIKVHNKITVHFDFLVDAH